MAEPGAIASAGVNESPVHVETVWTARRSFAMCVECGWSADATSGTSGAVGHVAHTGHDVTIASCDTYHMRKMATTATGGT